MVVRLWIYKTAVVNATRFEKFEQAVGVPMMLSQKGCLGVELMRLRTEASDEQGLAEYTIISRWQSWELLQAALQSSDWQDEVGVFLAQGFGEGNGTIKHYDEVVKD